MDSPIKLKKHKQPEIVIVVPNYNGATIMFKNRPILKDCLKSLKLLTYKNYKVVIGDGNSPDNSYKIAKRFGVDFYRNKVNYGPIKNNNSTIRYVIRKYNPKYILWFNNDALIIQDDFLERLIDVAEKDDDVGVEGCKLLYPNGKIQHAGVTRQFRNRGRFEIDEGKYDSIEEMEVTAAVCLYRTSMLKRIGLFDDIYYTSCEDVDLCLRARKEGYKVIYNGTAKAIHLEGFTVKASKDNSVKVKDFYARQADYTYLSLKYGNALQKLRFTGVLLGRAFFVLEDPEHTKKGNTINQRKGALRNLCLTFKAIPDGYSKYRRWISKNGSRNR